MGSLPVQQHSTRYSRPYCLFNNTVGSMSVQKHKTTPSLYNTTQPTTTDVVVLGPLTASTSIQQPTTTDVVVLGHLTASTSGADDSTPHANPQENAAAALLPGADHGPLQRTPQPPSALIRCTNDSHALASCTSDSLPGADHSHLQRAPQPPSALISCINDSQIEVKTPTAWREGFAGSSALPTDSKREVETPEAWREEFSGTSTLPTDSRREVETPEACRGEVETPNAWLDGLESSSVSPMDQHISVWVDGCPVPAFQQQQSLQLELYQDGEVDELQRGAELDVQNKSTALVRPRQHTCLTYVWDIFSMLLFWSAFALDLGVFYVLVIGGYAPSVYVPVIAFLATPPLIAGLLLLLNNRWIRASSDFTTYSMRSYMVTRQFDVTHTNGMLRVLLLVVCLFILTFAGSLLLLYYFTVSTGTALLSIPIMDLGLSIMLLVPPHFRVQLSQTHIVLLENYKLTRFTVQGLLESLPQCGYLAYLLRQQHTLAHSASLPASQSLLITALAVAALNVVDKLSAMSSQLTSVGKQSYRDIATTVVDLVSCCCSCRVPKGVLDHFRLYLLESAPNLVIKPCTMSNLLQDRHPFIIPLLPAFLVPRHGGQLSKNQCTILLMLSFQGFQGDLITTWDLEGLGEDCIEHGLNVGLTLFNNLQRLTLQKCFIASPVMRAVSTTILDHTALSSLCLVKRGEQGKRGAGQRGGRAATDTHTNRTQHGRNNSAWATGKRLASLHRSGGKLPSGLSREGNSLSKDSIEALSASLKLSSTLRHLDLCNNHMGPEEDAHNGRVIVSLEDFGAQEAKKLVDFLLQLSSTLRHLDLCNNHMWPGAAAALGSLLAEMLSASNVPEVSRRVVVSLEDFGAQEAKKLVDFLLQDNIGFVQVDGLPLTIMAGPAGLETRAAMMLSGYNPGERESGSSSMTDLKGGGEVVLWNRYGKCKNDLTEAVLSASSYIPSISHLNLSGLCVGDEGCMAVANFIRAAPCLTHLDLSHNSISDIGFAIIATALLVPHTLGKLVRLDLSSNFICDQSVGYLMALMRHYTSCTAVQLAAGQAQPAQNPTEDFDSTRSSAHGDASTHRASDPGLGAVSNLHQDKPAPRRNLDLSWSNLRSPGHVSDSGQGFGQEPWKGAGSCSKMGGRQGYSEQFGQSSEPEQELCCTSVCAVHRPVLYIGLRDCHYPMNMDTLGLLQLDLHPQDPSPAAASTMPASVPSSPAQSAHLPSFTSPILHPATLVRSRATAPARGTPQLIISAPLCIPSSYPLRSPPSPPEPKPPVILDMGFGQAGGSGLPPCMWTAFIAPPAGQLRQTGSNSGALKAGNNPGASPTPRHISNSGMTDSSDPETGCSLCFSNPNNILIRGCGHKTCVQCYRQLVKPGSIEALCPFCRRPIMGFHYRVAG
eukprot:gene21875-28907_t